MLTGALVDAGSASAHAQPTAAAPAAGAAKAWLPSTPDQWPLVVSQSHTPDQEITRGIEYHTDTYETVGGQQHATELDVDLANKNVHMGVVESGNELDDAADEVVSSMANRTGAVAGINGDFFQIYGSGAPEGMVVINGRLVKSPSPSWNQNLVVRADGTIAIGTESYSGTVTDGSASHAITSVNTVGDLSSNGLERITPDLGDSGTIPASTVVAGHVDPTNSNILIVDSITPNVTDVAQLATGDEDFAGSGTAGTWLSSTVHVGDQLSIAEQISPDNDAQQALSGGAILVQDGKMAVPLQGGGENNINDPVTGFGVTQDGKHAIVAVFDGHQPEDAAEGLTRPQLAGWMMAHGAYNAILFDSGGSSEMVARQPGQTQASVSNTPSDGHERPVANGLFFYSTERTPGPAVKAVANGGAPLAVLAGSTVPAAGYAVDSLGNPAADPARLSVEPSSLGTITTGPAGSAFVASGTPGRGRLVVRDGRATSSVPLDVTSNLKTLDVAPTQADLQNGATQQLTATATTGDKQSVTMLPSSVNWSVDPADLGTVDPSTGLFTAAADGEGMATVTATAGGATATVSIAVGQRSDLVDSMTDVSDWGVNPTGGTTASLSLSTSVTRLPTDTGSMDVHYSIPGGNGVKQVAFWPNGNDVIPPAGETQQPEAVGIWVKGTGTGGGTTPLGLGNLTMAESYAQVNGQGVNFYPSTVTYDGWQLITADLPAGLQYPLTVNYFDFLVINPTQQLTGDLYLSDMEALFSPRPPTTQPYVAIPKNPSWLQYTEDPSTFKAGGATLAALDDAHMMASDPNSTGSVVVKDDGAQIKALPQSETGPLELQTLGDMADSGTMPDLTYMKSVLDGLGVPYHEAVGNHETSQGTLPENGNWSSLFGATHYEYTIGAANMVVLDSSQVGILPSDQYQVPDEDQYQWLVQQLNANTSPVVFVTTHVPAYDPHVVQNSQFADRWEAQMYETLAAEYQASHPKVHLILLFGHARGFAENLLNPLGQNVAGGIPNFVVADAGMPAYAPVNQGGFYNYGLFHILPNGDVQFAVMPTLDSIAVSSPSTSLQPGQKVQASAVGTTPTGDDLTALQVPIADPASHVWQSSDPKIATVDPVTGLVTAHRAGTVSISVESDGIFGSITLDVLAPAHTG